MSMKIGITGATGFIGSELARQARAAGHTLIGYSRSQRKPTEDISEFRSLTPGQPIDATNLDAVINLAGESILGLWTNAKKERIRESRILATQSVVTGIRSASPRPPHLVNASAIGFYGNTGDEIADEDSPVGSGFLAGVSNEWENAAREAESFGTRVAIVRIGFVVGPGGALKLMKPVFLAGLGGKLGSGKQWMSCIHLTDVAGILLAAVENESFSGAVNAVQPAPVTNAQFTRTLGNVLHRPTLIPAPRFTVKMALGDFSHLLLDSQRIVPRRLDDLGYKLKFPDLESALLDATERL